MSDATRKAALHLLKGAVDKALKSFFLPFADKEKLTFELDKVKFTVTKGSYSQAQLTNITYEINLGALMPKTASKGSRSANQTPILVLYVLHPKEKDEDEDGVANKAAYIACLDDLINNKDSFISQKRA